MSAANATQHMNDTGDKKPNRTIVIIVAAIVAIALAIIVGCNKKGADDQEGATQDQPAATQSADASKDEKAADKSAEKDANKDAKKDESKADAKGDEAKKESGEAQGGNESNGSSDEGQSAATADSDTITIDENGALVLPEVEL